jgi:GTP-binding protein YchF
MALNLGIIGLPKSGKTTLFNAITGSHAQTSAYALGASDEPNVAVVKVPDPRLDVLTDMFHPRKTTPADVKFTDVAGMSGKSDDKKEPFSRQALGFLGGVDALVLVVRAFANPTVPLPEGTDGVDPIRDAESVMLELAFSDLGIIERRLERLTAEISKMKGAEREIREREQQVLTRIGPPLEEGTPIRALGLNEDDEKAIRNFGFLTAKPLLIVANLGEENLDSAANIEAQLAPFKGESTAVIAIPAQLEMEMAQLAPEEAGEFRESMGLGPSRLGEVVGKSYALLGLISFLTAGEDEVRAWTIRRGTTAQPAAGAIHTDLERGFIRAEVVHYDDLIAAGSMNEAKRHGHVRMEGKTYPVKDGDIVNILFTQTKSEQPK